MRRVIGLCAVLCVGSIPATASDKYRAPQDQEPGQLVARSYPVADLVTPIATVQVPTVDLDHPTTRLQSRFQYLIEHLRRTSGAEAWKHEQTQIGLYETTLSMVIRQTPDVHEQIAAELGRLRQELDVQVVLEFTIVTGPRLELADLAANYAGELGRFEKEELTKTVQESAASQSTLTPKITLFNRSSATVKSDGKTLTTHATVSDDRRKIRLKTALATSDNLEQLVATCQSIDLRDGRSAAIYFEADRVLPGVAPADDAQEHLVIVAPKIIVVEEEEELVLNRVPKD